MYRWRKFKEYPEYAEDTLDTALEAVRNKDGVIRAVPTTGYWEGLFCNKELFDKYNVKLPTDWESFVKAVHIFKKNGSCSSSGVFKSYAALLDRTFTFVYGGRRRICCCSRKAPETWVKAFGTLKELRDMGAFPEDTDIFADSCAIQFFQERKAAMQLEGSWYVSSLVEAGMTDKVTVVAFPGVKEQKAQKGALITGISSGFYITKKAWENPGKKRIGSAFCGSDNENRWKGTGRKRNRNI